MRSLGVRVIGVGHSGFVPPALYHADTVQHGFGGEKKARIQNLCRVHAPCLEQGLCIAGSGSALPNRGIELDLQEMRFGAG